MGRSDTTGAGGQISSAADADAHPLTIVAQGRGVTTYLLTARGTAQDRCLASSERQPPRSAVGASVSII